MNGNESSAIKMGQAEHLLTWIYGVSKKLCDLCIMTLSVTFKVTSELNWCPLVFLLPKYGGNNSL